MTDRIFPPQVIRALGKSITVEQMWRVYRDKLDVEAMDIVPAKRAFYAAILVLFEFQFHVLGDVVTSEDEGVEILERLSNEAIAFGKENGYFPDDHNP